MYVAFWAKLEPQTGRCKTFWQVTDTQQGAENVLADVKDFENTLSYGTAKIETASEPEWLEVNENWELDK